MPALSFQQRLVPFIQDGSEQHSIRALRKRLFRAGDTLQLFTAMRTKQCRLLAHVPWVKVEEVGIYRAQVWINGEELSLSEKNLLAWRDGFRNPVSNISGNRAASGLTGCFDMMLDFWAKTHGDIDFKGQMPHWDWARRVNA